MLTENRIINLLYIEDDHIDVIAFERHIKKEKLNYKHQIANTINEAYGYLKSENSYDAIICDYQLPDGDAIDILRKVIDIPVIIVTGAGDEKLAVTALKAGAYDYITKGASMGYLKMLPHTIDKALSHKQDRLRLKVSQERYQQLVESANDVIYETNAKGKFLFANNQTQVITGYSVNELLSMSFYQLVDEENKSELINLYKQQYEAKIETTYCEFEVLRKDGSKIWVGQNVKAMFDENHKEITGFLGVVRDISQKKEYEVKLNEINIDLEYTIKKRTAKLTEIAMELTKEVNLRQQVEDQLRSSRQDYINLFNNAHDSIILYDYKSIIIEANIHALKMYGYSRTEFIGMKLEEVAFHNGQPKLTLDYLLNQAKNNPYETIHYNKKGQEIYVEINSSSVIYTGKEAIINIVRNISRRRLTEQKLEVERRKRISALIDGQEIERKRISRDLHDGLGQLLTASKLYVNKLSNSAAIGHNDKKIISEIKEILDLTVTEVREISQDLLPSLLLDFGLEVSLKHIVKILNNNSSMSVNLICHGTILRFKNELEIGIYRIIQEVINNSVKHSKATQLTITMNLKENNFIAEIQDNGIGFESTKYGEDDYLYLGNGLYNIKQRVEILNLEIEILSAIGKGTTVILKGEVS